MINKNRLSFGHKGQWLKLGCVITVIALVSYLIHFKTQPLHPVIVTLTIQPLTDKLYFEGIIKPLNRISITSAVEGAIDQKYFTYGQQVAKGAPLFHLVSVKLQEDYRNAYTNYLKALQTYQDIEHWDKSTEVLRAKQGLIRAKNTLSFSQEKFRESAELMRLGYIARDQYISDKQHFADAELAYQEAEQSLTETLKRGQGLTKEIARLALEQAQATAKEIKSRMAHLTIIAPVSGIALFPLKEGNSAEITANTIIDIGSQVKFGDTLLTIGNLQGIAIDIHLNEVDLNRICVGQSVMITGVGFPDLVLKGKVTSIDAQAVNNSSSELPSFRVAIQVPQLTDPERSKLRVGMSAKLEVVVQHATGILIPIQAVKQEKGQAVVHLLAPYSNEIRVVPVKTGHTTLDQVEIIQGLKPGDKVIINDRAP